MKSKATSAWEQYIEYIVLIVAIAILAWFAWGAFGSKIEYRQGKITVYADTVDDELLKAANALERKIKDGTESPIDIKAPEPLNDKFLRLLTERISPKDRVVFASVDMTAELDTNQDVQTELREYVSPDIPEPQNMRTRQWFGTINESVFSDVEGLEESIEGPPHDTMWVQVAATVDIEAVLESYNASGELSAIPSQWYDGAIDIFDVEIQRQRKVDDDWTSPEIVEVLPGHLSYRVQLSDGSIDAIERDEIVRALRKGSQDAIMNPDFYQLKGLTPKDLKDPANWSTDIEIELTPLQLLQQDLQKVEEKILDQQAVIAKVEQEIQDENNSGGGGGGGRGGMGGSGGGGSNKLDRLKRKLDREQTKLTKLNDSKAELVLEIEELTSTMEVEEGESVLSGEVWVWGHDTNVVPGEVYRYRMHVQLANPFFGHKPSLYPRQHALANEVVMPSTQSDWSSPIKVEKTKQWFVKDAKPVHQSESMNLLDTGYISIDVFEFSDGAWTRKSRDVHVGQPIAQAGVEDEIGWFVLDVVEDVQGEIVLLQEIDSGDFDTKRPHLEVDKLQFRHLIQQMREQSSSTGDADDDDEDSSPDPSGGDPPGGGGRGGGPAGGGGRGGGPAGGGGRP